MIMKSVKFTKIMITINTVCDYDANYNNINDDDCLSIKLLSMLSFPMMTYIYTYIIHRKAC